jgi:hypothetical protein
VLAFKGEPADNAACRRYQAERFGTADGEIAAIELSSYAVPTVGHDAPRERFLAERKRRLRELLIAHRPTFFICYGTSRRADFEETVGGPFDGEGFRWLGPMLCALRRRPTGGRPAPPAQQWLDLGRALRTRIDHARGDEAGFDAIGASDLTSWRR